METQPLDGINLTVRAVNTTRNQNGHAMGRSASAGEEVTPKKVFDLPWTPDLGGRANGSGFHSPLPVLGSPGLMGSSSLPLFQPSPRRTLLCSQSPTAHFGMYIEAMLHSPNCASGAGEFFLGGSSSDHAYRLDTPRSRLALQDSIFTTPSNKHPDLHNLVQSSDSQRGFIDFAMIAKAGMHQQQPRSSDLKAKERDSDVQAASSYPNAANSPFLEKPTAHQALHSADQPFSPNSIFLMNQFCPDLDIDSSLNHMFQHQLQEQHEGGRGLSTSPLSPREPLRSTKLEQGMLGLGGASALLALEHNSNNLQEPLPEGEADLKTESENEEGSGQQENQDNADMVDSQGQDAAGTRTCHCKKSQCLKLYCDCFAAGLFCSKCACTSCLNRPEHGNQVMERRDQIMVRDPEAFSNKIEALGAKQGKHKKGCNCKRSHCLKKYCECFQGGVKCAGSCKCKDCKNLEDAPKGAGRGAAAKPLSRRVSQALGSTPCEEDFSWASVPAASSGGAAAEARRDSKRFRLGPGEAVPLSEMTVAYPHKGMPTPCTVSSKLLNAEGGFIRGRKSSMLDPMGIPPVVVDMRRLSSSGNAGTASNTVAGQLHGGCMDVGGGANGPRARTELNVGGGAGPGGGSGAGGGAAAAAGDNAHAALSHAAAMHTAAMHNKDPGLVILQQQRVTPMKRRVHGGTPERTFGFLTSGPLLDSIPPLSLGGPLKTSGGSLGNSLSPQLPPLLTRRVSGSAGVGDFGNGVGGPSSSAGVADFGILNAQQAAKQSAFDYIYSRSNPHQAGSGGGHLSSIPSPGATSSLPMHLQLLTDGRQLTVKAPTPRMQGHQAAAAVAYISHPLPPSYPTTSYTTPTNAKNALLDASMLMSPTASDGFDPMQMLASPHCEEGSQPVLFSSPSRSKGSVMQRFGPGSTKLLPSTPQSERDSKRSLKAEPQTLTT